MDMINPAERAKLAELAGLNEQYLYQCLTGRRDMDPERARDVETKTDGRIKRWMVTKRWHRIWPDLIGADGAPAIPSAESEARAA